MADDPTNPWSRSGWNVTAQGEFFKRMGKAGAERKAQEAGTFLGGPKPPPPGGDPKPEIVNRNFIMRGRRSVPVADSGGETIQDGATIIVDDGPPPSGGIVGQSILVGSGGPS